jgi:mannose-1-phosphate guanylyltransferase
MLQVVGLTMLERVLDQLARFGVDEAVLSLGYLPEVFTSAYPSSQARGIRLSYAVESEPLDTGGAIRFAAETAGLDETFLVVNGDVLNDIDVSQVLALHHRRGAKATISLIPVEDPSAYGVVTRDDFGRVTDFIEKPPRDQAPTNTVNAGTYVLEPDALCDIGLGEKFSIERQVFPKLAEDGSLYAVTSPAYWIDAGTPETLLRAAMDILVGERAGVTIPGHRRRGSLLISPGENTVEGLCESVSYVGAGAIVRRGARLRHAVVEANAVIDENVTLVSSLVLPGAVVGRGSVVEGSIIGAGAVVPENAIVLGGSVVAKNAELLPGCRVESERIPG